MYFRIVSVLGSDWRKKEPSMEDHPAGDPPAGASAGGLPANDDETD